MPQFKMLECDETGSTKYYAVRVEIEVDGETEIVDCVVYEYYDVNSIHGYCEVVSVEPEELEEAVKELEDEIIKAM